MKKLGTCFTCAFFEPDCKEEESQQEGICRRRAPVAIPSKDIDEEFNVIPPGNPSYGLRGMAACWPRVTEEDWCGDYVHDDSE